MVIRNSNCFTQLFIKYRTEITGTQLANEESEIKYTLAKLELDPFLHRSIKLNYFTE
jgi:hypothetical protein